MDESKTPFLHLVKWYCNQMFCVKKNYACHVVAKNGTSSILKTILWEDGKITEE